MLPTGAFPDVAKPLGRVALAQFRNAVLNRALDELDARSEQIGTDLNLLGVLLLNAPASTVSREYREFLRDADLDVFSTVIPRRQTVTNHARHGQPTVLLEPENDVARAYRKLARQVAVRLADSQPAQSDAGTDDVTRTSVKRPS